MMALTSRQNCSSSAELASLPEEEVGGGGVPKLPPTPIVSLQIEHLSLVFKMSGLWNDFKLQNLEKKNLNPENT